MGQATTRLIGFVFASASVVTVAMAGDGEDRRAANERFFRQSFAGPGLLVPLYVYPADLGQSKHWKRLIDLKRKHPRVPVCAIVNPASGPGETVDPNYTWGIRRLHSAGIVTLGYVSTSYANRSERDVQMDIDRWRELYPQVCGIFLDEMTSQPENGQVEHYIGLSRYAHDAGFWPVFANPGTMIHQDYFDRAAADVFVIHETARQPSDEVLRRLETLPSTQLGVLVHKRQTLDEQQLQRLSRYIRWVYVTEDEMPNPWDVLSGHSERLVEMLDQ